MDPQRLRNSGLTGPGFRDAAQAVARHGAMQAQEYPLLRWSLAQRVRGLEEAAVDRALEDGSLVRTHLLRPTWHLAAREDVRWLLALTGPRVQRATQGRREQLGLDARTLSRAADRMAEAVAGGRRLSRDEIAAALDAANIDRAGQRLPYLLMHAELEGVLSSGGPRTYASFEERVPAGVAYEGEAAAAELVRRYLGTHGPATLKDLSWWASLTVTSLRKALSGLGDEVTSRNELWSLSGEPRPPAVRTAHLLPAYDELVVGYTESRFLGDPRAAAARSAWQDRRLPNGILLLRGRIAGLWRRLPRTLDVRVWEDPTPAERRAVEAASRALGRFTGRPLRLNLGRL